MAALMNAPTVMPERGLLTPAVVVSPSTSSPVSATTRPRMTKEMYLEATAVVFVSLYLRAHIFINDTGGVRVNPGCGSNFSIDPSQQLLKLCTRDWIGSRWLPKVAHCKYASVSGKYMLAMERSTGRLTSVQLPLTDSKTETYCTDFVEKQVLQQEDGRVRVFGCAKEEIEPTRQLALRGKRVDLTEVNCNSQVGPFRQISVAPGRTGGRKKQFQTSMSIFAQEVLLCSQVKKIWVQCPGLLQESYPLLH